MNRELICAAAGIRLLLDRSILEQEGPVAIVDETKVRGQVVRLAASAEFARADRMVQFLQFVVKKTLEGDTLALRERQIGIAVFDRPSDWDPKLDNIVRSEARRLRSKLEAYAASDDPDETVRITMPTGGYGVHFQELAVKAAPLLQEGSPAVVANQVTPQRTPPVRRPVAGSLAWSLLIAAVCVLSTLLGVLHYRSKVLARVLARADEYAIEPFASEAGLQFSPAISADSTRIAFARDAGGGQIDIYSKLIDSGEMQQLTHDARPSTHPAWSPDGKQLAFLRGTAGELPLHEAGAPSELIVLNTVTHQERLIHRMQDSLNMWSSSNPLAGCQTLSWMPQGEEIVLTDPSGEAHGLLSISTITGEHTTITRPTGSDQDCYARVSPDGKKIAFVHFLSHAVGYLCVVDIDGSHLKRMTQEAKDLRGLDWTPDGLHLVFASKEGGVFQLRMISEQGGASTPLPAATGSASNPFVSPDGKLVAFVESHENWNIWRVPLRKKELGTPQRFLASSGQNHSPSFSPDGQTIAFVSDRSGNPEIWLSDRQGQHLRRLTHFDGPWLGTIRWSPDSRSIVFDSRPNGHSAIFVMDVQQGKPELIENQSFEVRRPSFSRDGRYIYFDTTRGGAPEIWRRDLVAKQDQLIAPAGFMLGIESTDGKRLFYQENEQRHLWVSDPDGGGPKQLAQVSPAPDLDWTPVGDAIYFASSNLGGGTDMLAFDLSTNKLSKLGHVSQNLALGTPSFVVSPDGTALLYSAIDSSLSEIKLRRGALPQ